MKRIMAMAFVMISILSVSCFADEVEPMEILKKVSDTYKSMETYRSEGARTINTKRDSQKTKMLTSYSIILKKPNLYRISFETTFNFGPNKGHSFSGAIWSNGTQPYEYESDTKSYSELPTDMNAIGRAEAMSSPMIISKFFSTMFEEPWDFFEQLINVKLAGIEKIEDEECYVISADLTIDKKETFWVSKTRRLILKHTSSFDGPENEIMPKMTDEKAAKMLKAMGQEVTDETLKEVKDKMQGDASNVKVFVTETQTQISSPELTAADFQFALPEGTVFEESNASH